MQLEMMPCPPAARAPGNDWPEWPRVLKTDYGQQEAIAKFGFDPRVYQTTVKEFYKNEAGQVCGALISKLKSEVAVGRRQSRPEGVRLRRYAPRPEPCRLGAARGPRHRRRRG